MVPKSLGKLRRVLECIPNFSEGRRPEIFQGLVECAETSPDVRLLDASRDPDHHRSVLTLAGHPKPLASSMLNLYEYALENINLQRHHGAHPRIGAVDVVPFVPLAGSSMETAVQTARELGRRVAERFDLPVYLYEAAALRPQRRALPELRRGGLDGLAERMARPEWAPDFGPSRLHPTAGATAVGARFFLIAVNSILGTEDLDVARQIAREVRESGGGLPAVRALGIDLPSRRRVQVSMNLVDHRRTSLGTLLAEVRRRAEDRGVEVEETEIIGLVPQEALAEAAAELRPSAEHWADRSLEGRLRRSDGSPTHSGGSGTTRR